MFVVDEANHDRLLGVFTGPLPQFNPDHMLGWSQLFYTQTFEPAFVKAHEVRFQAVALFADNGWTVHHLWATGAPHSLLEAWSKAGGSHFRFPSATDEALLQQLRRGVRRY